MAPADLLVLLDRDAAADARLDLAVGYAARHGALLKGMAFPPGRSPGDEMEAARRFAERTQAAGVAARWVDFPSFGPRGFDAVVEAAHRSGLVIAGQPAGGGRSEHSDLPARLILYGGRPVLTVPYAGRFDRFGDRVLVAWNDGRESTRALNDAMPILLGAKRVRLIHVIAEEGAWRGADGRLAGILDYLERAGVRAKGELVPSIDFPAGDTILNRACEEGSDLLVMGAYGHAGGRPVFGAVAAHVMRHMTLPVLMAH